MKRHLELAGIAPLSAGLASGGGMVGPGIASADPPSPPGAPCFGPRRPATTAASSAVPAVRPLRALLIEDV
ncbi:hypothetical protein, partial [Mycolicibacterium stellerae]|uniref:hypothetical protein n=1 Tax=Mycolicibacterium stellerae TaxID=2358193 RepID=UPI0019CFBBEA